MIAIEMLRTMTTVRLKSMSGALFVAIAGFTVFNHVHCRVFDVYAQEKSAGSPDKGAIADTDESRIDDLITAYRICVNEGVLDSFGHISVRSVKNPNHFYMPRAMTPSLVTRADVVELDMDANPVVPGSPRTNGERFIHSEIYKSRSDVQSVIHSHTMVVIPFSIAGVPLRPVVAQAGFLPLETPVFDSREAYGPAAKERGMLVTSAALGAALAKKLSDSPVVLMRGHGMVVVADSVKRVTVQAAYTRTDAIVQQAAMELNKSIISMDAKELAYNRKENFDVDRPWDNFKSALRK
jgi:ribulose-5-phosphate 4-epimerase/fuculose-1-phosphate aldolase